MKEKDEERRRRNEDLVRRMKLGENLKRFDSEMSWFPPRPIIKKDRKLMEQVHRSSKDDEKKE